MAPKNLDYISMEDAVPVQSLIGSPGEIRPVHAQQLRDLGHKAVLTYCCVHAIYQIPTIELLEWLDAEIPDKQNALEICAGHGEIGRMLGIRSTDSYLHTRPEIRNYYAAARQRTTIPLPRVEKLDANTAVAKYNPTTVFGSWITQYGLCGQSSMYGVHEAEILLHPSVRRYIMIGNDAPHGEKLILAAGPNVHRHPGLVSRGIDQSLNAIYDWKCK